MLFYRQATRKGSQFEGYGVYFRGSVYGLGRFSTRLHPPPESPLIEAETHSHVVAAWWALVSALLIDLIRVLMMGR